MSQPIPIEDRLEIEEVIKEAARAFDEKRHAELLPWCFTDTASILYRIRGQRIDVSMPGGVETFKFFHDRCYWTQHLVSPQVMEVSGDKAHARTPVHATHLQHRLDGSHNHWIIAAVYIDELTRMDGRWRIVSRMALCPSTQGDFLSEGVRLYPVLPDLDAELAKP